MRTNMREKTNHLGYMITLVLALTAIASSQVKVTVDRNTGAEANANFKFKNVPSPAKDDAAARAKVSLVVGQRDPAGAGLSALTDGLLPGSEDGSGEQFLFQRRHRRRPNPHGPRQLGRNRPGQYIFLAC
jgi:hypothetical protein